MAGRREKPIKRQIQKKDSQEKINQEEGSQEESRQEKGCQKESRREARQERGERQPGQLNKRVRTTPGPGPSCWPQCFGAGSVTGQPRARFL